MQNPAVAALLRHTLEEVTSLHLLAGKHSTARCSTLFGVLLLQALLSTAPCPFPLPASKATAVTSGLPLACGKSPARTLPCLDYPSKSHLLALLQRTK